MLANTKVEWTLENGSTGWGYTISDEHAGHVLVAEHSQGIAHHVIYCAVTWLRVLELPALAEQPAPAAPSTEAPAHDAQMEAGHA